jgi:hypothetical protein
MRILLPILVVSFCAWSDLESSRAQDRGEACTRIGCLSGLNIELKTTSNRWKPGSYRFDMKLDGHDVQCQGRLPLKSCDQHSIQCSESDAVTIAESGCALPPSAQGWGPIHIEGEYKKVDIKIMRDGTVIGHLSESPAYKTSRPNGPRCEPVCRQAELNVLVK